MNARQIVAKLLEYGIDPDAPRPGSPDDPWRKSGHMKVSLKKMDFSGPQRGTRPEDEEDEPQSQPTAKFKSRFQWKPPTDESVLQELGGYYCASCQSPTSPVADATGKLNCDKCGAEINYSHPKLTPSRDKQHPDARRRERPFPQHKPI